MRRSVAGVIVTMGLTGLSTTALAAEPVAPPQPHPQEPIGFVTGAVVGAFAGGPIGAVVGAGIGTWLGNRVHRAADARAAEAQVATLAGDKSSLLVERDSLISVNRQLTGETTQLSHANDELIARIDEMSASFRTIVDADPGPEKDASADPSALLDGLQDDVLFRTGSAAITPEVAHQVQVLAQAIARSSPLKVRIDGYADPRGADDVNMKLSQERADAVRDMLLAAGVNAAALEVNAYGKTQSVASDSDGYALERRVRVTLRTNLPLPVAVAVAVAQVGENE